MTVLRFQIAKRASGQSSSPRRLASPWRPWAWPAAQPGSAVARSVRDPEWIRGAGRGTARARSSAAAAQGRGRRDAEVPGWLADRREAQPGQSLAWSRRPAGVPGRSHAGAPQTDPSAMNQSIPGAPTPPRRVRLKPWLVAQVNSCQYPGLQWVNGEKKLFYIPWRHATRHGPSQDGDNTIFKAWAKETGKYTEGVDEADPAKWKANLRCALNKSRDFRLFYDGPRDMPPQPYKIYEVCSNGPAPTDSQPPEDYSYGPGEEEEEEEEELQRMLPSLSLTDTVQSGPHMAPYSLLKDDVKWPPTLQPPVVLGPPAPDPRPLAPPPGNPAGFRELFPEVLEPGPLAASLPPASEQLLPDLLISPHMLPLTDLEIKFQYRGRPPRALTISNPHGCRLFYSQLEATQEQVELFGPISLEQVRFPSPEDIPSDKQRFYTNQLLDVLDRGLILQLQGQDLYAIRLCQCKVFWSGPCASVHDSCPNPIQREVKTKLFSLEHFLNEGPDQHPTTLRDLLLLRGRMA
ncbi:PREDICTED: interferon regulatory factor 5 isoform X2 [Rhinopithecus bieti]|uniref:interferon regulatory factor 5 isoform X2 n=1 Tax=Rhinopithecus bieti TaxID=61621 RepID=UPI00083BD675|nr:PREDICTED: interferon regulatory factor 5 isoform X2 [Rhinopithecus bieti]